MRRIRDIEDYFRSKSNIEYERKKLNINQTDPDLIERLESLGALEVFRGEVISDYYYGDPKEPLFLVYLQMCGTLENIGDKQLKPWIRLRTMTDDMGLVLYFAETKCLTETPGAKEELGGLTNIEILNLIKNKLIEEKLLTYMRKREIKRRSIYVLPGENGKEYRPGLEYNLDLISAPVKVDQFLEIEGTDEESFLYGVRKVGMQESEFNKISAKDLIKIEEEKLKLVMP